MKVNILFVILLMSFQTSSYKIAVLKYQGGGDWYANPTSLPNLVDFCNNNINTNIDKKVDFVDVGSPEIFNYPFIHMTGHGNVVFSKEEAENLKKYLFSGGFLHIDDNYGMDPFIRRELNKIFPNIKLTPIPKNHEIFKQKFYFENGLPKIHEHDGENPIAYGLIHENRIICLYTFQCDLSDGWEDQEIHNNSEEIRLLALKMGANIIQYVFLGNIIK